MNEGEFKGIENVGTLKFRSMHLKLSIHWIINCFLIKGVFSLSAKGHFYRPWALFSVLNVTGNGNRCNCHWILSPCSFYFMTTLYYHQNQYQSHFHYVKCCLIAERGHREQQQKGGGVSFVNQLISILTISWYLISPWGGLCDKIAKPFQ